MSLSARILSVPNYRFSATEEGCVADDKLRGLQKFGPYQRLERAPVFAFVFPNGYNEYANTLYRALRTGIGFFRGMPEVFKVPLAKEQVFAVTGFSLPDAYSHRDRAKVYSEAILNWVAQANHTPDLFFVLHPRTSPWEDETPYHRCKSVLLEHGFLSQNVTFDLIDTPSQFEWSAANIALATFVKLGGIPWVINRRSQKEQVIIGVGRSESVDPNTRKRVRTTAFTTCLRSDGLFKFVTVGQASSDKKEYLQKLGESVASSVNRVQSDGKAIETLAIHLPKEFGRDENEAIKKSLGGGNFSNLPPVNVLKVADESRFFITDGTSPEGIPARGTCVRVGKSDYLIYTEGREEKQAWRSRVPSAIRVRHYERENTPVVLPELVSQVFDLSQTNWRAFNARSRPISIGYSELIARVLRYGPINSLHEKSKLLENRMWFL